MEEIKVNQEHNYSDQKKPKYTAHDQAEKPLPMSDTDGTYSFGDVAKILEVNSNNLRYYVDSYIDYIKPSRTNAPKRGNLRYTEEGIEVLRTIFLCKDNGMTKDQIIEVLEGNAPAPAVLDEKRAHDLAILAQKIIESYSKKDEKRQQLLLESQEHLVNNLLIRQSHSIETMIEEQTRCLSEMLEKQQKQINELLVEQQKKDEQIQQLLDQRFQPQANEKKSFFKKLFG